MKLIVYNLLLILFININLFSFFINRNSKLKSNIKYKCELIDTFVNYLFFNINQYSMNISLFNNEINDNTKLKFDNQIEYNQFFNIKIKIGIYIISLSNGGIERNTALLINYLSRIGIFEIYLFYNKKYDNEYKIPKNVKRILISSGRNNLKRNILINNINIFIYQSYDAKTIKILNNMKNLKLILYNHSCFLFWIYTNKSYIIKTIYNEYKNSKFVISIVPFENDYLFKKWGINSIYMNNFLTYNYDRVIQSDLSSQIILMIGRGDDKGKRFILGILSMKYIIKDIPGCKMIVISSEKGLDNLKKLVRVMYLEKNILFSGYTSNPEIYFKNSSLHIFPSISESFAMVLAETKIYGIPSILLGIDYTITSKEGTIIIYDDNPELLGKFATKVLKNEKYKKKLAKEARRSMRQYKNEKLFKKWVKMIFSINQGEDCYQTLKNRNKSIMGKESLYILNNQVNLLKKRISLFENITINNILNFSFINLI